jgi:branched-chain amino acid transport system substrate-binding protein
MSSSASPAAEFRGVTATEIRIGQTMPYSGPVSAFGALGKGEVGYFKMVNERGGINGRKVNLIRWMTATRRRRRWSRRGGWWRATRWR